MVGPTQVVGYLSTNYNVISCNIIVHDIGGLSSYIYVALAERSECGSGNPLADENLCDSFNLLRELLSVIALTGYPE